MKHNWIKFSRRYVTGLRNHLERGAGASPEATRRLGRQAVSIGMETLDLARIHEAALTSLKTPGRKVLILKRSEIFFNGALTPILETHRAAQECQSDLSRLNETLGRRTAELASTNRQLRLEIAGRKNVEAALKKNGKHYARLLKESFDLQEGLRQLTHHVLMAQEDERQKISTELQDEIAQTLLGINVRLISLKHEARQNTKGFKDELSSTQRLVIESARSLRRVARELRKS
jgi:signal transduction histidine kinase